MSGGSHNYIYSTLAIELGIPSGSYGINGNGKFDSYQEDSQESRRIDPMEDLDLSEMMYDVSCLLHSLEWYHSCDIGEKQYEEDKQAFKDKWFGRNCNPDMIKAYKQDIDCLLTRLKKEICDET